MPGEHKSIEYNASLFFFLRSLFLYVIFEKYYYKFMHSSHKFTKYVSRMNNAKWDEKNDEVSNECLSN